MTETELISSKEIDDLVLLARGNIDLVEEALSAHLHLDRGWFRPRQWVIDKEKVINHIKEHVEKLEGIPIASDDDPLE